MAAVERIDLCVRVAGEKAKESDEFITLSQLVNGTNITRASNGDILIDSVGVTQLSELTDVTLSTLNTDDVLTWNGSAWVNEPQDIPFVVNDKNHIHNQITPLSVWTINHPLGKMPSITILDSAGTQVHGKVDYMSDAQLIVRFQYAFAGTAYLN